jgi:putative nucleotidyltransferase with HDIG domain
MTSIRDTIIERLDSLTQLPSISDSFRQIQELMAKDQGDITNAAAIGRIIERDLGLSAKILKIANSVFYSGRFGKIGDLNHAVARMGIDEVYRICTMVCGFQTFTKSSGELDLKEFWKHSLGVALVMRYIAKNVRKDVPSSHNAYVAGLFHDIGILVLDQFFTDVFRTVLTEAKKNRIALNESERLILGIDHGEIGAVLCQKWRFPQDICEAVAFHHTPDLCPEKNRMLSQLIHIANFASSVLGIGEPGDCSIQQGSAGAWHDLKLDTCDLNKMAEYVEEGIAESGVFVSLAL